MFRVVLNLLSDRFCHWRDGRFDRKLRVNTAGIEDDLEKLRIPNNRVAHSYGHEAIQLCVFAEILTSLKTLGHGFESLCFLDLGAGRGRALLLAAEAGFKSVVGIELSPALCREAEENILRYRIQRQHSCQIELRSQDAVDVTFPEHDFVLFLYNPFDAVVMRMVLDRLAAWAATNLHKIVIVYRNAKHHDVLDAYSCVSCQVATPSFRIYYWRR